MRKIIISSLITLTTLGIVGCQGSETKDNDLVNDNIEKVFVYGSLRSDMFNYEIYLDGKVTENDKGTIEGDLFHLENKEYPAVVPGEGEVLGELMEFENFEETLKELDELEAYVEGDEDENEYNRKVIDVTLENGETEKAYYYEYNPPADYNKDDVLVPVESGDWKEYLEENDML